MDSKLESSLQHRLEGLLYNHQDDIDRARVAIAYKSPLTTANWNKCATGEQNDDVESLPIYMKDFCDQVLDATFKEEKTEADKHGTVFTVSEEGVIKIKEPVDVITRGKVIHDKREAKGYSQGDVAKLIQYLLKLDKFDYKRISDWEKGRTKTIPLDIKIVLYSLLDIDEKRDLTYSKVTNITKERETSVHVHYAILFADFVSKYISTHSDLSSDKEFTRNIKGDLLMLFNEFLLEQAEKEAKNK